MNKFKYITLSDYLMKKSVIKKIDLNLFLRIIR